MKTSNKILMAFLIVIMLVPVGTLLALRSKIVSSEYTLVRNDTVKPIMLELPASFHVIYINSVDRMNTCKLIPSKDGYFAFNKEEAKYVYSIFKKDTLFIKYGRPNDDHVTILGIPDLTNIIVDGNNIHIDDLKGFTKPDVGIQLYNATLRLEDESEPLFRNMSFVTNNSQVDLVKVSPINQLTLQSFGQSSFSIGSRIEMQTINAQLSADTRIAATWDFFQRIRSLK